MNPEAEKLYNLLPALYRDSRCSNRASRCRALCAVIAEEIAVLRENLDQLYDDQFIETCAEWVAPYIGDLIGYRPLHGVTARTVSARAEVANTIAYRRRKGTATVLEQLARDVTGWNARAVEFFQWLETSQYMNHIRLANRRDTPTCATGRRWSGAAPPSTRWRIRSTCATSKRQKGRYNIPNVGLFLWRLDAFSLTQFAGVSHRRRALSVQPARQRSCSCSPGRRAKPISRISPSRSMCRSRSAGACCDLISDATTAGS